MSPPPYDPFVTPQSSLAGSSAVASHAVQANPYSHDAAAAVAASIGGAAFFSGPTGFQQPLQYHLYAPIGPHSSNILGYQRNVHDLFLPNDFREELQKKTAATLQTLPSKPSKSFQDRLRLTRVYLRFIVTGPCGPFSYLSSFGPESSEECGHIWLPELGLQSPVKQRRKLLRAA